MKARRFPVLFGAGLLAILTATAVPAGAQDATAEVKTWSGQSWRLAQASLEVFYTILPVPREGEAGGLPPAGADVPQPAGAAGQSGGARFFGTAKELKQTLDQGPEPMRAQRERTHLTLSRDGVEVQVPLARLNTLVIARQPVVNSSLPPHVAPRHYRYTASAVLVDGARVEADYLNLGTALLRGTSPQGRVDIPLEEIETLRFER